MKLFLIFLLILPLCQSDLLAYWLLGGSSKDKTDEISSTKLIVLLLEGLSYNFFDKFKGYNELNGFKRLQRNGVKAEYVVPIFPSNGYPNRFAIVTGLYAQYHEIIDDYMYNEQTGEFFKFGSYNESNHNWWKNAEPVWITAEKHNIKTALYWWDGCHISHGGFTATYCERHRGISGQTDWELHNIQNRINNIIDKFSKNEIHLALIHIGGINFIGHHFGPDSKEMLQEITAIDNILKELQNTILKRKLHKEIVVMVIGDHGTIKFDQDFDTIINIENYININEINFMINNGAFAMIQPRRGHINKIYRDLKQSNIKGLQIFLRNELPTYYKIKESKMLLPIILLAEKGFVIKGISDDFKQIGSLNTFKGINGYDPFKVTDMRTIFYARGPGLKQNYISSPLEMVDLYNVVCHILGIPCLPNNGSWDRVQDIFGGESDITLYDWIITVTAILTIIVFGLAIGCKFTRREKVD